MVRGQGLSRVDHRQFSAPADPPQDTAEPLSQEWHLCENILKEGQKTMDREINRKQKEGEIAEGTPRSEKEEGEKVLKVLEQRCPAAHGGPMVKQMDVPEGTVYL